MGLDLGGDTGERLPHSRILVWCAEVPWRIGGLDLWRRALYSACRAGFERLLIAVSYTHLTLPTN